MSWWEGQWAQTLFSRSVRRSRRSLWLGRSSRRIPGLVPAGEPGQRAAEPPLPAVIISSAEKGTSWASRAVCARACHLTPPTDSLYLPHCIDLWGLWAVVPPMRLSLWREKKKSVNVLCDHRKKELRRCSLIFSVPFCTYDIQELSIECVFDVADSCCKHFPVLVNCLSSVTINKMTAQISRFCSNSEVEAEIFYIMFYVNI